MVIPPVESIARVGGAHYLFAEAAEKGYTEFVETSIEIDAFGDIEYDERLEDLKRMRESASLQAIVFSAMSFEAAIYDFAAIHLGDKYVMDHLDRLDLVSKWLVVIRFVAGIELPKSEAPFAALKSLVIDRNRLVHSKSRPFDFDNQEQQYEKIKILDAKYTMSVHNSFRALVLMSLYLDTVLDGHHNPLPSYDKRNAPMRRYYSPLKGMIGECREVVASIGRR